MIHADSAATRLTMSIDSRLPGAAGEVLSVAALSLFGIVADVATKEIVVTRIPTGEVVVRGTINRSFEWVADQMKRELASSSEAAWVSRWGDPTVWNTNR